MPATRDDTLMVVGLGDLGGRVVDALARLPVGRLIAVGRDRDRGRHVAGQATIVARLTDGAADVTAVASDVGDVDATTRLLDATRPTVIVMAASRHTWWRTPPHADGLPYGALVPLHVPLVRDLVRARDAAGASARIVALPFPDAVGPVLAPHGLAPDVGAGNVAEIAAKLQALAARAAGCDPREVRVRVVAHHATERLAFDAFSALQGGPEFARSSPPLRGEVIVRGDRLPAPRVRELLAAPHPLLAGRETHAMTAAATATLVDALMSDVPRSTHAPAPAGLPGGYPLRVSRAGVDLDLPDEMTEADAVAVNAVAARWDGIERIAPDGAVTFTPEVGDATERLLGRRLEHMAPDEVDAIADDLAARLSAGPVA
jgi:hypothetical protein